MYDHIEKILLKSNIAKKLNTPLWMTQDGEITDDETAAFGLKTTLLIERPDLGLVLDECGCNLSQEGDNKNGGELYLTGVNDKAYCSSATKHSHFSILGVTQLDGNPLLCVIIVSGTKPDPLVQLGIDIDVLRTMGYSDEDGDSMIKNIAFVEQHCGEGKIFPGPPTCYYKGKCIPGYVAFSENGGINATILTNIFRNFDNLQLFDDEREKGMTPFVCWMVTVLDLNWNFWST